MANSTEIKGELFENILFQYTNVINDWLINAQDIAIWLMWSLFAISMLWAILQSMLDESHPFKALAIHFSRRLLIVGVLSFFVINFDDTIQVALNTFPEVAAKISNSGEVKGPIELIGWVLQQYTRLNAAMGTSGDLNGILNIPSALICTIQLSIAIILLLLIALELFFVQIATQIILIIGLQQKIWF